MELEAYKPQGDNHAPRIRGGVQERDPDHVLTESPPGERLKSFVRGGEVQDPRGSGQEAGMGRGHSPTRNSRIVQGRASQPRASGRCQQNFRRVVPVDTRGLDR